MRSFAGPLCRGASARPLIHVGLDVAGPRRAPADNLLTVRRRSQGGAGLSPDAQGVASDRRV